MNRVDLKDPEQKKVFQDMLDASIENWMNRQFAEIGKWTLRGLAASLAAGLIWLYFHTGGFKL